MTQTITYGDGTETVNEWNVRYFAEPRVIEVNPCLIPEDDPAYTGEECPEPTTTTTIAETTTTTTAP